MAFVNFLSPLAFREGCYHGVQPQQKRTTVVVQTRGSRCKMNGSSYDGPDGSIPRPKKDSQQEKQSRSPDEMLMRDVQKFRKKREEREKSVQSSESSTSFRSVLETVLIWDFFLVLGLLAWLGVALMLRSAANNNTLLDVWLGLWQPFIQPVLGVLMLGAIAQGGISFFNSRK